jgi:hypothetical protein
MKKKCIERNSCPVRLIRVAFASPILERIAVGCRGRHMPGAPAKDAAGSSLALRACGHRYGVSQKCAKQTEPAGSSRKLIVWESRR